MDIRQLQYFVTCAQQRSFSLAAELLYTSQPHVSMVIRSLEQELNTRLFERTSKGVILTESGMHNYEHAVRILTSARLMQTFSSRKNRHTFTLFTNSSSNMAVLFARFFKKHPDYYYRYLEAGVEQIIEKIALHEAELGFVFVPNNKMTAFHAMLKRKKLAFDPLLQTDMVVYVGRNNPLYHKKSLKPEELTSLRFIQMTDDYFSFQELLGERLPASHLKDTSENVVETNSNHAMIQILQNSSLCNLCSYWLRDQYRYYDFHMIPVEGMENLIAFGCVSNPAEPLSELAMEFLAHVKDTIAREN